MLVCVLSCPRLCRLMATTAHTPASPARACSVGTCRVTCVAGFAQQTPLPKLVRQTHTHDCSLADEQGSTQLRGTVVSRTFRRSVVGAVQHACTHAHAHAHTHMHPCTCTHETWKARKVVFPQHTAPPDTPFQQQPSHMRQAGSFLADG